MPQDLAANDNFVRFRRCEVCGGRMMLAYRLPPLIKLPAQDVYECTACPFALPVNVKGSRQG